MKPLLIILFFIIFFSSCKKYLDIEAPRTELSNATVFSNDASAIAAQVAIYAQQESGGLYYYLTLYTGLSGDELQNHSLSSDQIALVTNNQTASNGNSYKLWKDLYNYIYQSNAVLEGLARSNSLTPTTKKQLEGEARFIRALCHFTVANLFGQAPLLRTTNYQENSEAVRVPLNIIYNFVLEDLILARSLLGADYKSGTNGPTTERVRPNRYAASALLARVYLYLGRWAEAESSSSEVIDASGTYQLTAELNSTFLKGSPEAIWQLMSVVPNFNTIAGGNFIFTSTPRNSSIAFSFFNSFRSGDNRKHAWTKSVTVASGTFYHPYKYKIRQGINPITEYTMVLRLAEVILTRAEARAMQNKLVEGEQDLNRIRTRAGLSTVSGLTKQALTDSIQVERRFELAFEVGDRWFDLKRSGKADPVLGPVKGTNWTNADQLYPIPLTEINRNPLLTQNPGY